MKVGLVGGFGAPPPLLYRLRDALRREGHEVAVAPLGFNLDCGEATVQRLHSWAVSFAHDEQLALVGHSRGGQLARVVAVRDSAQVTRLITVATPWSIGPPDRPGVAAVAGAIRALRRRGVPIMGSIDCATGACCASFRVDVRRTPEARWSVLWSSRDRFAGDDARPPSGAHNVLDLRTGHVGAVQSAGAIAAIARELR